MFIKTRAANMSLWDCAFSCARRSKRLDSGCKVNRVGNL